jgi:hypothetical protein
MVAAIVDIWRMALGHVAEFVLPSDPLDKGEPAKWCQLYWPSVLDSELESFDWFFARRVVSPAVLDAIPAPKPWTHALAYPGGVVTVRGLYRDPQGRDDPLDFELFGFTSADGRIDGLALAADYSDGFLAYTRRVEDVTLYTPGFVMALSWHLAAHLAGSMVRSAEAQKWCLQVHEQVLAEAQTYAARAQGHFKFGSTLSPLIASRC